MFSIFDREITLVIGVELGELAAEMGGKKLESRDSGSNVQAFLFPLEISALRLKKSLENPSLDSPSSLYVRV